MADGHVYYAANNEKFTASELLILKYLFEGLKQRFKVSEENGKKKSRTIIITCIIVEIGMVSLEN